MLRSCLVCFFCFITMCSSWLTFPQDQVDTTIIEDNDDILLNFKVKQNIIGSSSNLNFASPGMVVKCSWVSPAAESVKSDLLARLQTVVFRHPKHTILFFFKLPPKAMMKEEMVGSWCNHLFLPYIPKLNLVTGIFFAQTARSSKALRASMEYCIKLMQYFMLASVYGCDFLPEFPPNQHVDRLFIATLASEICQWSWWKMLLRPKPSDF
jgi:hypothetical protein